MKKFNGVVRAGWTRYPTLMGLAVAAMLSAICWLGFGVPVPQEGWMAGLDVSDHPYYIAVLLAFIVVLIPA